MLRSMLLLNSCEQYDIRMWKKFEETGLEPEAFVSEGRALWSRLGISDRAMDIIERGISSGWADRELDRCERIGARIVTCRDGIYPKNLLEIEDAPMLLYMRGEIFSPGSKSVAIVGTRRCSSYAAKVAHDIAHRAASERWCVVSGGAKGVDGASHAGCLEAGGRTIAVFGTGIDKVYPVEHRGMFEKIAETGAICSEYPLGASGEAWRFPKRNRVVVGLASRAIVVEAPQKSGSMITARLALKCDRDVWAVPGRIGDDRCAGSNRLLFDGATPLVSLDDFFGTQDAQSLLFPPDRPQRSAPPMSDAEKTMVTLLTDHPDLTIDNLAAEAKMSAAEVFKIMSVLSVKGVVRSTGPGRFGLND